LSNQSIDSLVKKGQEKWDSFKISAKRESSPEYIGKIKSMIENPEVKKLENFNQHGNSNTLNHVCHVAYMSHRIQRRLNVKNVDEESMVRGALLHDYYMYDARDKSVNKFKHSFGHAKLGLDNAKASFDLNPREENIIYSHMWPLNITHIPRCREAWLVTAADKICAIRELVLKEDFKPEDM